MYCYRLMMILLFAIGAILKNMGMIRQQSLTQPLQNKGKHNPVNISWDVLPISLSFALKFSASHQLLQM